jgi:hypothetical protein
MDIYILSIRPRELKALVSAIQRATLSAVVAVVVLSMYKRRLVLNADILPPRLEVLNGVKRAREERLLELAACVISETCPVVSRMDSEKDPLLNVSRLPPLLNYSNDFLWIIYIKKCVFHNIQSFV